jgi:hypothetical protein
LDLAVAVLAENGGGIGGDAAFVVQGTERTRGVVGTSLIFYKYRNILGHFPLLLGGYW